MIRINLLPYRAQRRQKQIFQHLAWLVGVLALVSLLIFAVNAFESSTLDDLKEEFSRLQAENAALKKKIGKIKDIDALRAEVENKLATVDTLQKGRFESLLTLNALANGLPKKAWLGNIQLKNGTVSVSGWAENNKVVAHFMREIDSSELFGGVRLKGISRIRINDIPVRRFELTLTRLSPANKEEVKGKVKK